jgi:methyl-accepting chemotaxis protein
MTRPRAASPHLARLLEVLSALGRGDLSQRCGFHDGPLGPIARSLDEALEHLSRDLGTLVSETGGVAMAAERLGQQTRTLSRSANRQSEALAEMGRRVETLGARSEEVGHIVELLEDVAAETNMLAVNAAIEASRAGTQGQGFGVVADEVRKLAERSAGATKEVGAFIQTIQGTSSEANRSLEAMQGLATQIVLDAEQASAAAGQLGTRTEAQKLALHKLRLQGHGEAELIALLHERRGDFERALANLLPVVDDPQIARTPLGDALRRVMSALTSNETAATIPVDGSPAAEDSSVAG